MKKTLHSRPKLHKFLNIPKKNIYIALWKAITVLCGELYDCYDDSSLRYEACLKTKLYYHQHLTYSGAFIGTTKSRKSKVNQQEISTFFAFFLRKWIIVLMYCSSKISLRSTF